MEVFCTERFKQEFFSLLSHKPYRNLETEIIEYFFGRDINEIQSGTRLNNSLETPFIKKRLNGSGGYRFYFLVVVKDKNVYLTFVHPKTGPKGSDNITDESKAAIQKEVYEAIRSNDLYSMEVKESRIEFTNQKIKLQH